MYSGKKIVATIEAKDDIVAPAGEGDAAARRQAIDRTTDRRLKRSKYLDEIVIATTVNDADHPLVDLANRLGVKYFRGSELDVLSRVLGAAQSVNADIINEVTGDCPLVDHALIDRGIEEFLPRHGGLDYLANFVTASFPVELMCRCFPTAVLTKVNELTQDPIDHTHVSYYIYDHPEHFRIYNWTAEGGIIGRICV